MGATESRRELLLQDLRSYLGRFALAYARPDKNTLASDHGVTLKELDAMAVSVYLPQLNDIDRAVFAVQNLSYLGLQRTLESDDVKTRLTTTVRRELGKKIWIDALLEISPYLDPELTTSEEFRQATLGAVRSTLWSKFDQETEEEKALWADEEKQFNFDNFFTRSQDNDNELAARVTDLHAKARTTGSEAWFRTPEAQEFGRELLTRRLRQGHLATALELASAFGLSSEQTRPIAEQVAKRLLTDPESLYSNQLSRNVSDAVDTLRSFGFTAKDAARPEWRSVSLYVLARLRIEDEHSQPEYESHQDFLRWQANLKETPEAWDEEGEATAKPASIPLASLIEEMFGVSLETAPTADVNKTVADTMRAAAVSGFRISHLLNDPSRFTRTFGEEVMESAEVRDGARDVVFVHCRQAFYMYTEAILPFIRFFHLESELKDQSRNRVLTEEVLEQLSLGNPHVTGELVRLLEPEEFWVSQSLERGIGNLLLADPKKAAELAADFSYPSGALREKAKEATAAAFGVPVASLLAEQFHLSVEELSEVASRKAPEDERARAMDQMARWEKGMPGGAALWLHLWGKLRRLSAKDADLLEKSLTHAANVLALSDLRTRGAGLAEMLGDARFAGMFVDEQDVALLPLLSPASDKYTMRSFLYHGLDDSGSFVLERPLSNNPHLPGFLEKYPLDFDLYVNYVALEADRSLDAAARVERMQALVAEHAARPAPLDWDKESTPAEARDQFAEWLQRDMEDDREFEDIASYAVQEKIPRAEVVRLVGERMQTALEGKDYYLAGQLTEWFKLDRSMLIDHARRTVPALLETESYREAFDLLSKCGDDIRAVIEQLQLGDRCDEQWLENIRAGRMEAAADMYGHFLVTRKVLQSPEVQELIVQWAVREVGKNEEAPRIIHNFEIAASSFDRPELQQAIREAVMEQLVQNEAEKATHIAIIFGLPNTFWDRPDVQTLLTSCFVHDARKKGNADELLGLPRRLHLPETFHQSPEFQEAAAALLEQLTYHMIETIDDDGTIERRSIVSTWSLEQFMKKMPFDEGRRRTIGIEAAMRYLADGDARGASDVLRLMRIDSDELRTPRAQQAAKAVVERAMLAGDLRMHDLRELLALTGLEAKLFQEPSIREAVLAKLKLVLTRRPEPFVNSIFCEELAAVDACGIKDELRALVLEHPETYLAHLVPGDLFKLYKKLEFPSDVLFTHLLGDVTDDLRPLLTQQLTTIIEVAGDNTGLFSALYPMLRHFSRECPWVLTEAFEPIVRTQGEVSWFYVRKLYELFFRGAFASKEDARRFGVWMEKRPEEAFPLSQILLGALEQGVLERPLQANAWFDDYLERFEPDIRTLSPYANVMRDETLSPKQRAAKLDEIAKQVGLPVRSDPFGALGISESASDDEVKRAYRLLATEHHPDRGGDPERFKEVTEAYQKIMSRRRVGRGSKQSTDPRRAAPAQIEQTPE